MDGVRIKTKGLSMKHWNSLSPMARARMELHALKEEGAPAQVQVAAEMAISYARRCVPVPADIQAILLSYAAERQQQDRYGK